MSISFVKKFSHAALLCSFFVTTSFPAFAQVKSLDRRFDPVAFDAGEAPPLSDSLIIAELTAFRYEAATEQWIAIPFQIDELDDRGRFFRENDGYTDYFDEFVFMPNDAGDQAPASAWLNDDGARANSRFEIELEDPVKPGSKAWIYLYRKVSSPPPPPTSYLSYRQPPEGTGADEVEGTGYVQTHAANGWLSSTAIKKSDGSRSADLVDTQKIRIKGVINFGGVLIPYEVNETWLDFISLQAGGGPVRWIREVEVELRDFPLDPFTFVTQYYPYSTSLVAKNAVITDSIATLAGVQLVRQSLDLAPAASGMRFYDAFNPDGINIDGNRDANVDTSLVDDDFNWLMASGDPGTILVLITVPAIGSTRSLYYFDDDDTGRTRDGTEDTGDLKSYGDFGIKIQGSQIAGTLSFDLTTYHLDPTGDAAATGEEFKALHTNRLQVTTREQNYTPTRVSDDDAAPREFQLYEAFPNPFSTHQQQVRIRFDLGTAPQTQVQLRVFNLLGQEVARFADLQLQSSTHEIVWDGRDLQGQQLPAGVYFYKLTAGSQQAVKKLVLTR